MENGDQSLDVNTNPDHQMVQDSKIFYDKVVSLFEHLTVCLTDLQQTVQFLEKNSSGKVMQDCNDEIVLLSALYPFLEQSKKDADTKKKEILFPKASMYPKESRFDGNTFEFSFDVNEKDIFSIISKNPENSPFTIQEIEGMKQKMNTKNFDKLEKLAKIESDIHSMVQMKPRMVKQLVHIKRVHHVIESYYAILNKLFEAQSTSILGKKEDFKMEMQERVRNFESRAYKEVEVLIRAWERQIRDLPELICTKIERVSPIYGKESEKLNKEIEEFEEKLNFNKRLFDSVMRYQNNDFKKVYLTNEIRKSLIWLEKHIYDSKPQDILEKTIKLNQIYMEFTQRSKFNFDYFGKLLEYVKLAQDEKFYTTKSNIKDLLDILTAWDNTFAGIAKRNSTFVEQEDGNSPYKMDLDKKMEDLCENLKNFLKYIYENAEKKISDNLESRRKQIFTQTMKEYQKEKPEQRKIENASVAPQRTEISFLKKEDIEKEKQFLNKKKIELAKLESSKLEAEENIKKLENLLEIEKKKLKNDILPKVDDKKLEIEGSKDRVLELTRKLDDQTSKKRTSSDFLISSPSSKIDQISVEPPTKKLKTEVESPSFTNPTTTTAIQNNNHTILVIEEDEEDEEEQN